LFYRKTGGDWWIQTFDSMEESITLSCPECEISVTEIYAGIELE